MHKIVRIPAVQFTFDKWRAGSLMELGIPHREWSIIKNKIFIQNSAIGFTEGHKLSVRPKVGYVAVMFFHDKLDHFWTHLTHKEFLICFPYLKNTLQIIEN